MAFELLARRAMFSTALWSTFEQTLRARLCNAKQLGNEPGLAVLLAYRVVVARVFRHSAILAASFFFLFFLSPAGTLINHRPRDRPLRRDYADTRAFRSIRAKYEGTMDGGILLAKFTFETPCVQGEVCFLNDHRLQ